MKRQLSAIEKPVTAQCIWLSFHCPQASFELNHAVCLLTFSCSTYPAGLCGVPYLLFITQLLPEIIFTLAICIVFYGF